MVYVLRGKAYVKRMVWSENPKIKFLVTSVLFEITISRDLGDQNINSRIIFKIVRDSGVLCLLVLIPVDRVTFLKDIVYCLPANFLSPFKPTRHCFPAQVF